MFTMPADAVRTLAAPGEQGWFVVKVDEVKKGDLSTAPAMVESTRAQFNQFAGEEYAAQFARAVAADVGLERNDKAIDQLRQELAGGAAREQCERSRTTADRRAGRSVGQGKGGYVRETIGGRGIINKKIKN